MLPAKTHRPRHFNPYPQLRKVAVLPFFNQSSAKTLDARLFTQAYFHELQQIPGFEVLPPGVVEQQLLLQNIPLEGGVDFQALARKLGADALVVGAITDFEEYYPPRVGLAVAWYAANPSFHPIPPGYGLPWGTSEEHAIPDRLLFESEFALAVEQLKTQTPPWPDDPAAAEASPAEADLPADAVSPADAALGDAAADVRHADGTALAHRERPLDWPDPRGFHPPPPRPRRPPANPQHRPVMSHTRVYHGADEAFTRALACYHLLRDDARFGGWQGYLERKDDLIRFCCYLHVTEMLAARGGADETQVVWRWPTGR